MWNTADVDQYHKDKVKEIMTTAKRQEFAAEVVPFWKWDRQLKKLE